MPALTISAITEPLYSVRPTMTAASARYFDLKTSYSANSWYEKIIRISTGMARNNSTIPPATHRTGRWFDKRPMPRIAPRINANRIDTAAATRVPRIPGIRYVVHDVDSRNGSHFAAVS